MSASVLRLFLLTHGYAVPLAALRVGGVRVHSGVISHGGSWLRLWYLLRFMDTDSQGWISIEVADCCQLLSSAPSTLYEWLRAGKQMKAFRSYRVRRGRLTAWLGGLIPFCQDQGLESWGAVEIVPLDAIASGWQQLKERATLLTTYQLQEQSRYAARHKLKKQERDFYRIPTAADILKRGGTSEKPEKGQCPFLLHVGRSKAFVSKAFVPFGASQQSIAQERNCSDRTIRRHLSQQEIDSRQICQAKGAYRLILAGLEWEASHLNAEPGIIYANGTLIEPNGISANSTYTSQVSAGNFFKYHGKVWRYRCSVYGVNYSLTSMRARRHSYKSLMRRNRGAGGYKPSGELINCLGLEGELSVPGVHPDRG